MLRTLLLAMVLSLAISNTVFAIAPGEKTYRLVSEDYVVQSGDTLDSITKYYMKKNTYGPREYNEFLEGICELNYKVIKEGIKAGDVIRVNYWIPNQGVENTNDQEDSSKDK